MSESLLQVKGLKTWLGNSGSPVRAVDGIDFDIARGETFVLLGESGCGKSMTALSIMGLLPSPGGRVVEGEILLNGENIVQLPEVALRIIRGNRVAMIFQEPMTSLNPVMTIGEQIGEVLRRHQIVAKEQIKTRVLELLDAVGIPDPQSRFNEYPHQLSGGMKQRVMIAIALAGNPDLLIADEPTTALDVTIQAQVLDLLARLQKETGMAMLLITHDLGVVSQMADRVGVMYAGEIVETADRDSFFKSPKHPYSQKLFQSLPDISKRETSLEVISGTVPSLRQQFSACRFAPRCDRVMDICKQEVPMWTAMGEHAGVRCHLYQAGGEQELQQATVSEPGEEVSSTATPASQPETASVLEVQDLKVHFPIQKGILRRTVGYVYAVDGVDLQMQAGRTLALVGESGCGKTTVGKAILQLLRPHGVGHVQYGDTDMMQLKGEALRKHRAEMQIIFQDPYSSMNPRMLVGDIIVEGMQAQGILPNAQAREKRLVELMQQVGLSPEMRYRYPHEFSGGQRQRICIARALAVNPQLIVCDEPTSALDVSVQAQILNLLKSLQQDLGLSYLFITHDISVVSYLAHDLAVMYLGRIVERGPVEALLSQPKHPYTRALLAAVPVIDIHRKNPVIRLEGDIPSPINPPKGCHFHPRCPEAMAKCKERYPGPSGDVHMTRCFLYSDE